MNTPCNSLKICIKIKIYTEFDGKNREIGTFVPIPSDGILELEWFLDINVKSSLDGSIQWCLKSEIYSWFERDFDVMRGFLDSELTFNLVPGKLWFCCLILSYHGKKMRVGAIWN